MHDADITILIAEDDDGHARLIEKNLLRAGIQNQISRFKDGSSLLAYLMRDGEGPHREPHKKLLLLLDIRMPKLNGVEVLRRVKLDQNLKKMPVIMISTTDDPREIEKCHELGCSVYVVKPLDSDQFIEAIRKVGLFLQVVSIPEINGAS